MSPPAPFISGQAGLADKSAVTLADKIEDLSLCRHPVLLTRLFERADILKVSYLLLLKALPLKLR